MKIYGNLRRASRVITTLIGFSLRITAHFLKVKKLELKIKHKRFELGRKFLGREKIFVL